MRLWTYGEALDRVNHDLDLDNEAFIQDNEMVGYFNEALDDINAKIQDLNKDYLKKYCAGVLTQGQSQVLFTGTDNLGQPFAGASMPPDLYANKIRGLVYQNGAILYPVKRFRGENMFMAQALTNQFASTQDYRYDITNPATQGYRMDLFPPARENGTFLMMWYLRNMSRIPYVSGPNGVGLTAARATVLDVPEFVNYIIAYVKCLCLPKEGDPRFPLAAQALEMHLKQMTATLTERVPDDDNRMEMELGHYEEHN